MSDESKLSALEAHSQNQSKSIDRIESSLKDWRSEMTTNLREWRQEMTGMISAHEKATDEKLKHAKNNQTMEIVALRKIIDEKVSQKELTANEQESDERYQSVLKSLDTKANVAQVAVIDGRVAKVEGILDRLGWSVIMKVIGAVLAIVVGGGSVAAGVAIYQHRPEPAVSQPHGPVTTTAPTTVTVQAPKED